MCKEGIPIHHRICIRTECCLVRYGILDAWVGDGKGAKARDQERKAIILSSNEAVIRPREKTVTGNGPDLRQATEQVRARGHL